MKILALIDVSEGASLERIGESIEDELRASWRLFKEGTLREAYASPSQTRIVFILEAENATAVKQQLVSLPLIRTGLLRFELVELLPFINWERLFAAR